MKKVFIAIGAALAAIGLFFGIKKIKDNANE